MQQVTQGLLIDVDKTYISHLHTLEVTALWSAFQISQKKKKGLYLMTTFTSSKIACFLILCSQSVYQKAFFLPS